MSIFRYEKDMQEWLEDALKENHGELYSLIHNAESFEKMYKNQVKNLDPVPWPLTSQA